MKKSFKRTLVLAGFSLGVYKTNAQFSLTGQLRTRTELRDGYATLNTTGSQAAFFTSQRTRLTFGYKWDKLTFNVSAQDVRVWGQDASSINNADGSKLMIHEAWAEIVLLNAKDTTIKTKWLDNVSLKIGRQEIVYDDSRLIGNLDWLQQARRHDAILLKTIHKGWQYDLGFAFNQNTENSSGSAYLPGNIPQYVYNSNGTLVVTPAGILPLTVGGVLTGVSSKAGAPVLTNNVSTNGMNQEYKYFQYVYVSRKVKQIKFAGLFFKDDFGKYRLDSVGSAGTGYVYGRRYDVRGTNSRYTYGLMVNGTSGNVHGLKKDWQVGAYFQNGKDKDGKTISAQHYTASFILQKGKFSFGPGYDYLSGDEATTPSTETHRFDPLYGTPHKFWGYMDYFYAGSGSAIGGLQNFYFKTKYTAKDLFVTFDVHQFSLAKDMFSSGMAVKKNLGWEFDLTGNYTLNKFTTIEAGYCFMSATSSMEVAKAKPVGSTNLTPQWGYIMIIIRPDFFYVKKA